MGGFLKKSPFGSGLPSIRDTLDPGGLVHEVDIGASTINPMGSHSKTKQGDLINQPPNPNAPGSIMTMGQRLPFNPNIGVPMNGISTNGLQPAGYQPGVPTNGISTNGLASAPNWGAIIGRALQRPPSQQNINQGMPIGPSYRV